MTNDWDPPEAPEPEVQPSAGLSPPELPEPQVQTARPLSPPELPEPQVQPVPRPSPPELPEPQVEPVPRPSPPLPEPQVEPAPRPSPPLPEPQVEPARPLSPPELPEPQVQPAPRLPAVEVPTPGTARAPTTTGPGERRPRRRRFLRIPLWGWLAGALALVALAIFWPSDDEAPGTAGSVPVVPSSTASIPADSGTELTEPPAAASTPAAPITTAASAPTTAAGGDDAVVIQQLLSLLISLPEVDPDPARTPYERDTYDGEGWGDADGDCISTRHEILTTSSLDPVTMDPTGCFVESGRWVDPYTGNEYTSASDVTIDHVVPLAEAHRSGAWRWDLDTRHRFANDEFPGHLVVVGGEVNQAKADMGPDEWLPPDPAAHCQYAANWITTKVRYALTITTAERSALETVLGSCSGPVRPIADAAMPMVVVTIPAVTTTSTIAPTTGPGEVTLIACDARAEVVTIGNGGGEAISLSGYTLHDFEARHSVLLGQFGELAPGQQLRLLSGPDASAGAGDVIWTGENVWNNDGDTAYLIAPDGSQQQVGC